MVPKAAALIAVIAFGASARAGTTIPLPAADLPPPEVSAVANPRDVQLGGRFTLFVTAVFAQGVEVNLAEPLALGPQLELKRRVSEDRGRVDGRREREWQLDVIAWDVGELVVPPIAVTFTANGHAAQVATDPVHVHVAGVLADHDDTPRKDADPIALMARDWRWVYVGGGAMVAVGLAWRARRRRRSRVVELIGVPKRGVELDSVSERALARLVAIEQSGVLARDDDRKRGYAEMVDVVRDYVGARYRVATLDLTSAELVRALAGAAAAADRDRISAWLARCDRVKYGGARTTTADAHAVLAGARELVLAIAPVAAREVKAAA